MIHEQHADPGARQQVVHVIVRPGKALHFLLQLRVDRHEFFGGHVGEDFLKRCQAACGRADSNDGKTGGAAIFLGRS